MHQSQLVLPSPSYSTAFSVLWQGLNAYFFFHFVCFSLCRLMERQSPLHKISFYVNYHKVWSPGWNQGICLYLEISKDFKRLIILNGFWFVDIPFGCIVKFLLLLLSFVVVVAVVVVYYTSLGISVFYYLFLSTFKNKIAPLHIVIHLVVPENSLLNSFSYHFFKTIQFHKIIFCNWCFWSDLAICSQNILFYWQKNSVS